MTCSPRGALVTLVGFNLPSQGAFLSTVDSSGVCTSVLIASN
jgi:hypothetical protein